MKFKTWINLVVITAALLALTGTASAHVTVVPKETKANTYERYTVRVPVEKAENTTGVRLEFPTGVTVGTVLPVPGWNYELEKDAEGRFKAITWTATSGGIKQHEFMEFGLSGKNPTEPGTLSWKAYQTYADGSEVAWTGEAGSNTPAPVVTVIAGVNTGHDHGANTGAVTETKPEPVKAAGTSTPNSNPLPLILAGVALLVAVISLFRKKV